MMGFWDGSGFSWTICKQSAPRSRQTTTPTAHQSIFTGRSSSCPTNSVKALNADTRPGDAPKIVPSSGRIYAPPSTWFSGPKQCLGRYRHISTDHATPEATGRNSALCGLIIINNNNKTTEFLYMCTNLSVHRSCDH